MPRAPGPGGRNLVAAARDWPRSSNEPDGNMVVIKRVMNLGASTEGRKRVYIDTNCWEEHASRNFKASRFKPIGDTVETRTHAALRRTLLSLALLRGGTLVVAAAVAAHFAARLIYAKGEPAYL